MTASPDAVSPGAVSADDSPETRTSLVRSTLFVLLGLAILAAGAGVSVYWMTHKPKASRARPEAQAALVEAAPVRRTTRRVVVQAMGTVVPVRSVQLASRVAGEIVSISPEFVPGGRFRKGDRILQVDPKDYELAVRQRTSELVRVQSDLKLESGQQTVARREAELLGREVKEEDKELLLRKPQLAQAQAAVASAEAALEKARLDLARTSIVAPFNAIVASRNVNLGAQVSPGTTLASLVGTDEYWVRVSVPVDQLSWVRIPAGNGEDGSPARVCWETGWAPGSCRHGKVARLMTELEPQGRMARLLVAVEDPLSLRPGSPGQCALILDSYVRVEIEGREVRDVVEVPRAALRDGNRVWILEKDNTLGIRHVGVAWAAKDFVCVSSGLRDGERLITSDLAAPVQGMALRTAANEEEKTPPQTPAETAAKPAEGRP